MSDNRFKFAAIAIDDACEFRFQQNVAAILY